MPLFICDGPVPLKNDTRDDLFCVVNFGGGPEQNLKPLRAIRPKGPLMCGEHYPGWFDSWGKPHHTGDSPRIVNEIGGLLDHNASFSMYLVHGGTSFGFTAGANCPPFSPQVTSYDYDAPISQAGWDTPKFHALRELFLKHPAPGEMRPEVMLRAVEFEDDDLVASQVKKNRRPGQTQRLDGVKPVHTGTLPPGKDWQIGRFEPTKGWYFWLAASNSHANDESTTLAELYLLGADGKELPCDAWRVAYADSEETDNDDGRADHVLDLQDTTFRHTQWESAQPKHRHQVVLDLGSEQTVSGVRCLPRQDSPNGRIGEFRLYLSPAPFPGL